MSPVSKGQKGSLKCGPVWFAAVVTEATTIRPARREDVPAILAIYNAAVLEPSSAYEDVPHTLAQREEWVELLMPLVHNSPGTFVLATICPPGHMQNE